MKKRYIIKIAFVILLILVAVRSCSGDKLEQVAKLPDTVRADKPIERIKLKKPDLPAVVVLHLKDTLLRREVEKKSIIIGVEKYTERRFLKKPKHLVAIQRIDTLGEVSTIKYDLIAPEIDFRLNPEGFETDPKAIRKLKRKIFWIKVANTAADIGKVGGGIALGILAAKQL